VEAAQQIDDDFCLGPISENAVERVIFAAA
jgi:hypothetical protein